MELRDRYAILLPSKGGEKMTKTEFLKKLQEELEQGMAPAEVRENVEYYRNYIEDEKAKGESEDAVVNSLGDPWAIAKNILESPGGQGTGGGGYYEDPYRQPADYTQSSDRDQEGPKVHVYNLDAPWKRFLLVAVVILILVGLILLITGVVSFLAPVIVPIFLVILLFRLFGNRR